jgi:multidrug transporter EmrE-like cation transporter
MNPVYIGYAWCAISSLFSALATYLIKRSTMQGLDWNLVRLCWLAGAVSSYVLGFGCYSLALSKLQMSLAYPVMTAVTMILVTTIGYLALGEQITPAKIGGIALLAAGAWLLTR